MSQQPTQGQSFAEDLQKTLPSRVITGLSKVRVTVPNPSTAYTGHAIGIGLADGVECIVIAASREHCIQFMEMQNIKRSQTQISTPVVMISASNAVNQE